MKFHPFALSEKVSKGYNAYDFVDWRLSDT